MTYELQRIVALSFFGGFAAAVCFMLAIERDERRRSGVK